MFYCYYDNKSDVFLNKPVIRPAIEKEEMMERVYSDLDFKENDNIILLTYKAVNDKPSGKYWNWYTDSYYPDEIVGLLDDIIVEFNEIFENTDKTDYFKTMMTAEITEYNESSKCIWHIIVNTKNISFDEIKNRLKNLKTGLFQTIEFDSIFVNNTEFPKPYKWRWYIEPVSNVLEIISKIMDKYAQYHKRKNIGLHGALEKKIPKKPDCFFDWPIWRINGHLSDTVDAQYVPFNKETLHKERCEHKQYYDIPDSILNKYNLYTAEEIWGFDEI